MKLEVYVLKCPLMKVNILGYGGESLNWKNLDLVQKLL